MWYSCDFHVFWMDFPSFSLMVNLSYDSLDVIVLRQYSSPSCELLHFYWISCFLSVLNGFLCFDVDHFQSWDCPLLGMGSLFFDFGIFFIASFFPYFYLIFWVVFYVCSTTILRYHPLNFIVFMGLGVKFLSFSCVLDGFLIIFNHGHFSISSFGCHRFPSAFIPLLWMVPILLHFFFSLGFQSLSAFSYGSLPILAFTPTWIPFPFFFLTFISFHPLSMGNITYFPPLWK